MNYKDEVLKVYPDDKISGISWYTTYDERSRCFRLETKGYFVNIPTVWMPQGKTPKNAWYNAYLKIYGI
jgi:hypothetical protein